MGQFVKTLFDNPKFSWALGLVGAVGFTTLALVSYLHLQRFAEGQRELLLAGVRVEQNVDGKRAVSDDKWSDVSLATISGDDIRVTAFDSKSRAVTAGGVNADSDIRNCLLGIYLGSLLSVLSLSLCPMGLSARRTPA